MLESETTPYPASSSVNFALTSPAACWTTASCDFTATPAVATAYPHTVIITIVGYDFEVNSNPVPYGDLEELFGGLTGTLAPGDPIDNIFYQGGGSYTGTIALIPEPSTALLLGLGLAGLAAGRTRSGRPPKA